VLFRAAAAAPLNSASLHTVGPMRMSANPRVLGHLTLACVGTLAGCAIPPGPVNLDTVPHFDLCLCVTAEPPRSDRGQCVAELARRGLACDAAEWAAYWARRRGP
jgi:hypothetical protein